MLSKLCQQQVQLIILGQADNNVCFRNALFNQKVDIGTVTAQNQTTLQLSSQKLATVLILFDNLYLNALLFQHGCQKTTGAACTDDENLLQLFICIGEGIFKFANCFVLAYEVNIITRNNVIITMRNNHLMTSENHGHQDILRDIQILQRDINDWRILLHLSFEHTHLAVSKIIYVQCGWCHQDMVDFTCSNTLRIDYKVNFHIILKHFR